MIQIRHNVFETNSSSSHSLVVCTKDQYDKFKKLKLFYINSSAFEEKFLPVEEIIDKLFNMHKLDVDAHEELKNMLKENDIEGIEDYLRDYYVYSFNTYGDVDWAEENYYTEYKTPGGETISIFGYYGYNG